MSQETNLASGAPEGKLLAGNYAVLREIGRGGMATVYLAHDRRHDRQVAVKVLEPALSAALDIDRFAREIKVVARLQHPHILPLYDSGEAEGLLFFVMPLVEGGSLRARLARSGAYTLAATVGLIRQLADALDYAHARGVVHRDVKPENVLLADTQALLADFGIARAALASGIAPAGVQLTDVGISIGTPMYMSPEQATGEAMLDGHSDQYSLGCVCYELLAGVAPFRGPPMSIIRQHLIEPVPPLQAVRGDVGDEVASVIVRALAKDPEDRFQSVGAFALALESALAAHRRPSRGDEQLRARQRAADARTSVFVFDFNNISGAADLDWLSTGIAETISVDLRKLEGIRVVGSDAGTRLRLLRERTAQVDADAALAVGRAAGARWVVWGGFQSAGSRIRLTPHFGDATSGETIASEKLDGSMDDIFALQDRIVSTFAHALNIPLTAERQMQIAQPETSHLTAYEHHAKGLRAFRRLGKESAREADTHFRAALAIDPNYALAWLGLGSLLMPKYIAFGRTEDLEEGVATLQRAMELDPSLGEPYSFLAYMYLRQRRYDESIASARIAIEREPGSHMGWYLLGIAHLVRGFETPDLPALAHGIPPLLRCMTLAPAFHPSAMAAGALYLLRGQYGHAIAVLDAAVAIERSKSGFIFLGAHVLRAALAVNTGALDDAERLLDWALEEYPSSDHVYAETMTAYAYAVRGCLEEQRDDLPAAERCFTAALALAEQHQHRLGIGYHAVRAVFGLARVASAKGLETLATERRDTGRALLTDRPTYIWTWIGGASDADAWYECASAEAAAGNVDEAITALRRAAHYGWADVHQLHHDKAMTAIRNHPHVRTLLAEAALAVTVPPPVGNGGFPDLSAAHDSLPTPA